MILVLVGKKKKNISAEELKWEDTSLEEMMMLASTPALFGGARSILFVGAIAGERGDDFLDIAKQLAASEHTFIFEEEKLLKGPTTLLEKAGARIEVAIATPKKERGFDPFGLTGALAERSKKKLWLALTASLRSGEKPEAISGLLQWKVRDMLSRTKAEHYSRDELKSLARELVVMYHDSHRGAGELELLLERFALKL